MTEMGAAAIRYGHLGLSVIPVMGKKPWFENWPEVATRDEETIRRWWTQTPTANVGIATGQKSNVFVFDVDAKSGGLETYEELQAEHGRFPNTWQQVTGGGGVHLFFRYPNFRIPNFAGLYPGIDIRGDGGQVVAPPSIHPDTKRRYEWDGLAEIEQTPLAEAPAWLLEVLQAKTGPTGGRHLESIPERIPKGVQHHTLVSLAGMMRRLGLTPEEIYPTIQAVNDLRCQQPGPPENIRKIANSMARYRPADQNLYSTATKLWRMTRKAEGDIEREQERLKLPSMDGLAVYRSQALPPTMVIDSLLYNGLTLFAGKSKAGKSMIALQVVLAVAMGMPALGNRAVLRPGGVAYYSLEMGENRTAARMKKMLLREDVCLQNIEFVWDCLPMLSGGIEQLDKFLEMRRPVLAVIDTFLAFVKGSRSGSEDLMQDQYQQIAKLKALADKHDTAMLLIHHTRKSGSWERAQDAGVDLVAGTRGITAACDSVWIFRREDEDMFCLDVTGRDVEEQSIAVQFDKSPESFGWRVLGDMRKVKEASDDITVLRALESEGFQKPHKITNVTRFPLSKVSEILQRLHREGRVQKNAAGAYYTATEERRDQWNDQ